MLSIVQFIHPGQGHGPDRINGNKKSWNTGPHKRKFLLSNGTSFNRDGTIFSGMITFWGEWEPPSTVEPIKQPNNNLFYPEWLHRPYLPSRVPTHNLNASNKGSFRSSCEGGSFQNTDPFVFGSCFKYFVCKQYRPSTMKPTKLAKLDRGSVVIFGSKAQQDGIPFFQIDTVFVVADYLDYDTHNEDALIDERVPNIYRDIVYKMAFPEPTLFSMKLRLYFGATYTNPFNGMYSFVPAKPFNEKEVGFPRIRIKEKPYITDNLSQGFKTTKINSPTESYSVWNELRQISQAAGCVEAVTIHCVS